MIIHCVIMPTHTGKKHAAGGDERERERGGYFANKNYVWLRVVGEEIY